MRITKNRLIVRVALVIAILAAGGIAWRYWQIRQPAYHWQRAVAALKGGNDASAELELRACLARLPNHGPAHFQLARLLARQAEHSHAAAGAGATQEALGHFRRAAELLPQEADVQHALLRALVSADRLDEAENVAATLARLNAADSEADVLLARQALRRHDGKGAADRLGAIKSQPTALCFTRWWLQFELAKQESNAEKQAAAIAAATQAAISVATSGKPLSLPERKAASTLVLLGIETAPDAAAVHRHAKEALKAVAGSPFAPLAGQLGSQLELRFPKVGLKPDERQPRQLIAEQLAVICQRQLAVDAGGPPAAYRYLAERAIADGDSTRALKLLDQGLAAAEAAKLSSAEKLPLHLLSASLLMTSGRYDAASQHTAALVADPAAAGQGRMIAGSIALAQGRYEDARAEFELAAQQFGATLQVRLALATTYLALGRPADALPHLSATIAHLEDLGPTEKAWLARYVGDGLALRRALYETLLALDKADEAAPHLPLLRGTPHEAPALIALAGWHWRHNRQARADAVLTAARSQRPDDIGLTLAHAAVIAGRGAPQDGDALVGAFAALKPEDLSRQMAWLQWRVWRGQAADALAMLPELRQRFGGLPVLQSIEAQLLLATDRSQEALAAADQLRHDPQGKTAGALLAAAAALNLGRTDDAASLLQGAGTGPLVDLSRARLLSATGKDAAALDLLVSTLSYRGAAPQASAEIGSALDGLAKRHGTNAALEKAGRLLAQKPDEPVLLAAHANLALAAGQAEIALTDLSRLEKLLPKSALVHYLRAQAMAIEGQTDSALAEVDAVLAIDAAHADARLFSAELLRSKGRLAQATAQAEAALRIDPARLEAAALAAEVLLQLRRGDEAIGLLARFVAANHQQSGGYIQWARSLESLGRSDEALKILATAQQRLPRDFEILSAQVATLMRSGRTDAAQQWASRRAAEHPDAFAPEQLGWLMLRLRQFDAARHWADQFLATAGDRQAEAHWLLGNVAQLDGAPQQDLVKLAEAESHFRKVLELHPGHLGATNNLAWLLATNLNQPQQALALMQGLLSRPELNGVAQESLPPTVIDTLAVVLAKADRSQDARNLLARAVRQYPQNADLHYQFGLAQLASQNYAEASTALQTALRLGLTGDAAQRARQELDTLEQQGHAG